VHFIGYNLARASCLDFAYKSTNFCFSVGSGRTVAAAALNFEHVLFCCAYILCTVVRSLYAVLAATPVFDPGPTSDPVLIRYQVFILTLSNPLILCMSFLTTENIFFFLFSLVNVLILPNSGCSIFILFLRNHTSVPPHQGPDCHGGYQITKIKVCQCPGQPAQASPSGHFGHH
jgi:hypothetical protein